MTEEQIKIFKEHLQAFLLDPGPPGVDETACLITKPQAQFILELLRERSQ